MKRWADRFFKWFCHPDYYPDIKGDLEELYQQRLSENPRTATRKYMADVILLMRLSLLRPVFNHAIINTGMLRNYFIISLRNLRRHKVYTAIHVLGLAIGLSGFLLIYEYIRFEKSYDAHHEKAHQVHRVSTVEMVNGIVDVKDAMASYSTGELFEQELPEVTGHTVTYKFDEILVRNGENTLYEKKVISADSSFFDHFTYRVLQGSKDQLVNEPFTVVLTESKARAYFGDEDPVGKTLEVLSPFKHSLKVTGVVQDIPLNTHYHFDMIISDGTLEGEDDYKNWNYNNYYVYVRLREDIDRASFDDKVTELARQQYGKNTTSFWDVHPVQNIYLHSDFTYEPQLQGSKKTVSFLTIISLFVLLIAWVNYVNLSTARAVDRAKEVGLRKVVGAFKRQLVGQFLFEALLVNLLGALLAIGLSEWGLVYFNQLVGKETLIQVWNHPPFLLNLVIFMVIGTIVSGFYPAMVLSGFRPITVLKGKFRTSKSGVFLRKGLVVVQFTASLILIASTFTVYRQVQFMKGKDLGISTDHVVTLTVPTSGAETPEAYEKYLEGFDAFKEELRNHTAIETVGGTSNVPGGSDGDINTTTNQVSIVGISDPLKGTTYVQYNDDYFLDAVDMQLVAGRDFDRAFPSDSSAVMANEAFLRRFNVVDMQSMIGAKLKFGTKEDADRYTLIGIVGDYNRTSLKSQVEPTLFFPWLNARSLVIELHADRYQDGLDFLADRWEAYYPNIPLDYRFLDERFAALYAQDQRFGAVFGVFAALAIFVATLGLFGLASFLSIQRTKEVGIRKVLGASISGIIVLFYRDFMVLLTIAALLGTPTVYISMNNWLANYAYHIDFPWLVTLGALAIVILFALVTVGYQTYKVAIINPSRTIRYE